MERFTRDGESWTHATFEGGETVPLTSVDLTLAMDDLYADVPLSGT